MVCLIVLEKNHVKKHELAKDTIVTADLGFLKRDDVHEYQVPNAPVNSPRNSIDVNEYDWVKRISTKHNRPYYVDTKTGVSTWEPPKPSKPSNPDTYLRMGEKFGAFLREGPAKIGPDGELIK